MKGKERKYPALETISVLLKVLAVIIAIFGIISALAAFVTPGFRGAPLGMIGTAFSLLLVGTVPALVLYALGEIILLLMDIEHNTFLARQGKESMFVQPPELPQPAHVVQHAGDAPTQP